MIVETGQVIAVHGDSVDVRASSRDGCARCAEGRGCGGGVIGMLLADRLSTVTAQCTDRDVEVGDRVTLAVRGSVLVRAAAVVYILPLATMLVSLLTAALLWTQAGTLLLGLAATAGLCGGFVLARWLARRRNNNVWRPRVVSTLRDGQSCG